MEAEIAIIGGSGLYELEGIKSAKTKVIRTPYGKSPEVTLGVVRNRRVAFLPRHGKKHSLPPHVINYRANLWALRELGVRRAMGITACGSLNPRMKPGELALLEQFVDFTKRRVQTFYGGGKEGVAHVDVTQPYCPELREILVKTAERIKLEIHPRATYACTEGPRFETAAEIGALRRLGCDLVGMTNVPECVLARELEMCYAAIGVITNFAAGISKRKLTHDEVAKLMGANLERVRELVFGAIERLPEKRACDCGRALEGALVEV